MKLGDLVLYIHDDRTLNYNQMGIIINGPIAHGQTARHPDVKNRWEVFWMYCNKTGWWDEHRMEVICESR